MLKKAASKAAASEEARRTLRYVEPLSAARTPLANFFSILLEGLAQKVLISHEVSRKILKLAWNEVEF
jgi:hypothetical protein